MSVITTLQCTSKHTHTSE